MNETTAKDRSYRVRARIAEIVGAPAYSDFSTETRVLVQHPAEAGEREMTLLSTSNAGFRGIEGSFDCNGTHVWGRSLGYVVAVENAGEWETV